MLKPTSVRVSTVAQQDPMALPAPEGRGLCLTVDVQDCTLCRLICCPWECPFSTPLLKRQTRPKTYPLGIWIWIHVELQSRLGDNASRADLIC
jgi:hypothetical protein